jgi:aryl-alcohol dehydrogenase-like predicted oxidoreductase
MAQVALAWVLNQPFNPHGLIGARSAELLQSAWDAADRVLSPGELDWLDLSYRSR